MASSSDVQQFDARSLLGCTEGEVREAWSTLGQKTLPGNTWDRDACIDSKSFKDCRYLNAKALGLSVCLKPPEDGRVDVVFLYNEGVQGFRQYSAGPLPEGLSWTDVGRDVVGRFGEPSDKFGGGRLPVGISYDTLGLDINFKNNTWQDAVNPINYLAVFPSQDQCFDLCVRCAKRASFHCGRCKLRRYCSSKCQAEDWVSHKQVCLGAAVDMPALSNLAETAGTLDGMD
mmetsp:Transcript_8200/g.18352  ORF Transcript_8200/g.18352 Transcript_8200/m.18352 type:complete len:230 (-) Transcript_8200:17-706(-)